MDRSGAWSEGRPGVPPRPDRVPLGATWRPIEALPLGLLILLVVSIAGAVLALMVPPPEGAPLDEHPPFFVPAQFVQAVALGLGVVIWVRRVNRGPIEALGVPPREPLKDVGIGVGVAVGMVFLAGAVVLVTQEIAGLILGHEPSMPDQLPKALRGAYVPISGILVILGAPVSEELFFRGFLYGGMRTRYPVWLAALASGFFFGFAHYEVTEPSSLVIIPALIMVGVVLALVYERRRSLLAPIAAHAAFNVVGFVEILLRR